MKGRLRLPKIYQKFQAGPPLQNMRGHLPRLGEASGPWDRRAARPWPSRVQQSGSNTFYQ